MLQNLTKQIGECYAYASECRARAKQSLDPATKQDFLDQEHRWLSMAHNYEFAERLTAFSATPFIGRKRHKK
jgi:hypothetical protein